jgi:hypothetical protein
MNQLIHSLTQYQLIRRIIGGHWYLIADYQRDAQYWMTYRPEGYQVLNVEYWG